MVNIINLKRGDQMDILSNGLDSFKKSLEYTNRLEIGEVENSEREFLIKDIILMLHHSIETLFKYMLIEHNSEAMVWKDFDRACEFMVKRTEVSNLKSVSFLEAISRFYTINKRELRKYVWNSYYMLNEYRNSIMHFDLDFEGKEVEHLIANIISEVHLVFNDFIACYKEYLREYDLNSEMELNQEYQQWYWFKFSEIIQKIENGYKKMEFLDNHQMQQIFKRLNSIGDKNNSFIYYKNCPLCKKHAFLSKGVFRERGEIYMEYGECKVCDFKVTNWDAYFLSFIEPFGDGIVEDIKFQIFNEVCSNGSEFIKEIPEEFKTSFQQFVDRNIQYYEERIESYLSSILIESIEENDSMDGFRFPTEVSGEIIKIKVRELDEYEFAQICEPFENLYSYFGNQVINIMGEIFKCRTTSYCGRQEYEIEYKIEYDKMELETTI